MGNAPATPRCSVPVSVHPHVHGERGFSIPRQVTGVGSSPRTWGTLWDQQSNGLRSRFIPTYMGNAITIGELLLLLPVHPHVHGERYAARIGSPTISGSSPRTWGTRNRFGSLSTRFRFIPTYMGNASSTRRPGFTRSVHPHVHGERQDFRALRAPEGGSSPRTWGTRGHRRTLFAWRRFIPTYMGNAGAPRRAHSSQTVHPHVHGERPEL